MAYVELIHTDTDAIRAELARLTRGYAWWDGFDWATVKGHIDTAKAELDKEPKSAPWTNYLSFDVDRRAVLEGGDGCRRDVTELLDRL